MSQGGTGARTALRTIIEGREEGFAEAIDRIDKEWTSIVENGRCGNMSPHIHIVRSNHEFVAGMFCMMADMLDKERMERKEA